MKPTKKQPNPMAHAMYVLIHPAALPVSAFKLDRI